MISAETCRRTGYTKNDRHNDTAVSRLLSFSSHYIRFEYAAQLSTLKRHPFHHTSQRCQPRPAAAQVPYHHNTILAHHHTPPPAGRPDAATDATSARVAAGPPLTPTLTRRRPDTATLLAVPACSTRLPYPFTVPACWQGCSPA